MQSGEDPEGHQRKTWAELHKSLGIPGHIAWIGVQGLSDCITSCLQAMQDRQSNGRIEAIDHNAINSSKHAG